MQNNIFLKDYSNIAVIGGGPAGSFFAHFAARLAKKHKRKVIINIFCGKDFIQKGPAGCKMCAGILSENLLNKMEKEGIFLSKAHVQHEIDGYYFQAQEYGIPLHHPKQGHKPKIVTVFRGNGPRLSELTPDISFDDFLLKQAASQGVRVFSAVAEEIELPKNPHELVNIHYREYGIKKSISVDLVVGAFGINSPLVKRIVGKEFGYREPRSVRTCNAELPLGHAYIHKRFRNTIYVFALGIKPIKFAAFIPKGEYITVSLVGNTDITRAHLTAFMKHPRIRELLPDGWTLPENLCICFPKITISHARRPYANRLVILGDASISRSYKNGIESAFDTARLAANTIFERGISDRAFKQGYYKPALKRIARDNFFGNIIFYLHDYITSRKQLVNVQLALLAKRPNSWESREIKRILWDMITGDARYKEIFFHVINIRLHLILFPYLFLAYIKRWYNSFESRKREKQKKVFLEKSKLGPLENGQTVVIIGGGPAGSSCAISLKNLAKKRNIDLKVIVYEMKNFGGGIERNACAGVLSQPIEQIIEDKLGIPFPWHLVKREIPGYYLHAGNQVIRLDGEGEVSFALRRIKFDEYLLQKARESGATVIQSKVTDVEISEHAVTVYSESRHVNADVVIGAFGVEEGTSRIFESETSYKSPKYLLSIITKFHPKGLLHDLENTDGFIHAFLPALKEIEFGAITPKGDHYTINIAGENISSRSMNTFLHLPEVLDILPENFSEHSNQLEYHRGSFPIKPAKNLYGNRYVTIGDAAGLIRPFKGKGVNAACLMGIKAAETMMEIGISKDSFRSYIKNFQDVIKDLPYARVVRRFVIWGAFYGFLAPLLQLAKIHPTCKKALFDSVSGKGSYREILMSMAKPEIILKILTTTLLWLVKNFWKSKNPVSKQKRAPGADVSRKQL
ncbi:MAG: hypothetical protein MRJ65_15755 [Candidatus Brocadiaceae bacterium]|nr:hypothetical protein [Candidatus Brocadiaceae bacterium]